MSTRTSSRDARTGQRASTGRFARSSSTPRRTPPRRYGMAGGVLQRRRTPPPPSGLKGALAGLSGMLPAAGKATPSSKKGKAGGFALLTAAAGFAFSNRDKLGRLIGKRGGSEHSVQAPRTPGTPGVPGTPPPA